MTTNHITAKSITDLVSVPRIMLGFDPTESIVVLGINGTRVEFCARMDIDHVETGRDDLADQINSATTRGNIGAVVAMGFSTDTARAAASMGPLIDALDATAMECLAISPTHWWNVIGGAVVGDATPHSTTTSLPSLQAVVAGVNVALTREAAVAAVQGPKRTDANYSDLMEHSGRAAALVADMTAKDQAATAVELAAAQKELNTAEGALLAALMNTKEGADAVMEALTIDMAAIYRPRLADARRSTPATRAGGVLAVLGMTCWLDGEGAQAAECLSQLDVFAPDHSIGVILRSLHINAIPPSIWGQQR